MHSQDAKAGKQIAAKRRKKRKKKKISRKAAKLRQDKPQMNADGDWGRWGDLSAIVWAYGTEEEVRFLWDFFFFFVLFAPFRGYLLPVNPAFGA
jgi:hypothetical protein